MLGLAILRSVPDHHNPHFGFAYFIGDDVGGFSNHQLSSS